MNYLNAFLLCGLICAIGEIILDKTKLTPGHITSLFVIIGAGLGALGLYKYLKDFSLIGSSIPITSFGNSLFEAAYEGFKSSGFIGMFHNLLSTTSTGITGAIFFGFIFAIIFRVRD